MSHTGKNITTKGNNLFFYFQQGSGGGEGMSSDQAASLILKMVGDGIITGIKVLEFFMNLI